MIGDGGGGGGGGVNKHGSKQGNEQLREVNKKMGKAYINTDKYTDRQIDTE